jgi:hypothetical protein
MAVLMTKCNPGSRPAEVLPLLFFPQLFFLHLLGMKPSELAKSLAESLLELALEMALISSANDLYDLADGQGRVFGQLDRILHLELFGEALWSRVQVASEQSAKMRWREFYPPRQFIGCQGLFQVFFLILMAGL